MTAVDYRTLDLVDFTEARRLEALAEVVLPTEGLRYRGRDRTRGPRQEALRIRAKTYPEARGLFAQADAAYWRVILRHDGVITKEAWRARRLVPVLRDDLDTIRQLMRTGWLRAAFRFDTESGVTFPTYARSWAIAALQFAPDRQTAVSQGKGREGRAESGGWAFVGAVEHLPSVQEDRSYYLRDRSLDPETALIERETSIQYEAAISTLPPRTKAILEGVAQGQSREVIGRQHEISRERVRQVEQQAIRNIRAAVA